jgi:hypothetical protein
MIIFMLNLLCSHKNWGQSFIYMDFGIGNHGKENITFADFDLGAGYTIINKFNCFGGLRLDKYFLDVDVSENNEEDITESFLTLNLYLGATNYFKLIEFKENKVFDYCGFFPELRFMFNPYLPRKITYEHDGTVFNKNGDFKMQASYGYGGGIFFKTKTGLIALKIEFNSTDPFEVLRNLEYGQKDMPFSKGEQFLISLRLSGF